jgi:seryl-tRNA synthetase
VYCLDGRDKCLVGTAEIPLAALYANSIIPKVNWQLSYMG